MMLLNPLVLGNTDRITENRHIGNEFTLSVADDMRSSETGLLIFEGVIAEIGVHGMVPTRKTPGIKARGEWSDSEPTG